MPKLIGEMKDDLEDEKHRFAREFYIVEKGAVLNITGKYLAYYFEDHEDLQDKINILENYEYITDITSNNIKKYKMTEEFVELIRKHG